MSNRDFGKLENFQFMEKHNRTCKIDGIINKEATDYIPLKPETRHQLKVWEDFIDNCTKHGEDIPSFPIWAMEFGATYEFKEVAPAYQQPDNLRKYCGKLGCEIKGASLEECLSCLPNYAQTKTDKKFPEWKIRYIEQNRSFYDRNKEWLDCWLQQVKDFENSHLKMEWNCGKKATHTLYDKIIQFRASGIRVKLPTFSPALNLCGTQIPIFPWVELPNGSGQDGLNGRYMTVDEAAKLQGMLKIKFGNDNFQISVQRSFAALGNAVNVTIVKHIAKRLLAHNGTEH